MRRLAGAAGLVLIRVDTRVHRSDRRIRAAPLALSSHSWRSSRCCHVEHDRAFQRPRLDLFAVYWMGPAIAHAFVSFGFADGAHVAFSIETRREKGASYSSVQGFFGQFTLYYAVGDERDIVRLRTNYRHDPPEQVYL